VRHAAISPPLHIDRRCANVGDIGRTGRRKSDQRVLDAQSDVAGSAPGQRGVNLALGAWGAEGISAMPLVIIVRASSGLPATRARVPVVMPIDKVRVT
jgi:hypothetical protein